MNLNQRMNRIYKTAALFLSIALMLPSPAFANRPESTGVSKPILSQLEADLAKLGPARLGPLDHLGIPTLDLSRREWARASAPVNRLTGNCTTLGIAAKWTSS